MWGLPFLANIITPHVPIEWEKGLGKSALSFLAPEEKRCNDNNLQQAVDEIVARLNAAEPSPYAFKVFIVKSSTFNAFALPGGNIIVFSGLIEKAESPEALASVLAHEMQHVKKRHVTQKVIENSSTGLILSALSGDVTGSVLYGASAARTLASLSYSRQYEEEADESGMKMLIAADINPEQMIAMYEIMKKESGKTMIPKYISTHPELDDRISRLKKINELSKSVTHDYKGLSSDSNWEQIKKGCAARNPKISPRVP
jgi:predicted Zn-dependent protease